MMAAINPVSKHEQKKNPAAETATDETATPGDPAVVIQYEHCGMPMIGGEGATQAYCMGCHDWIQAPLRLWADHPAFVAQKK